MISNDLRTEVLTEALPYMQAFNGKTVVIKYGGNAMNDAAMVAKLLNDVVWLRCAGVRPVLVHGGGPEINALLEKLGIESIFHNGLRATDAATMDAVAMALGRLNKDISGKLCALGGQAIGLCGQDSGLMQCKKRDEELGFVGDIVSVNTLLLQTLLDNAYIPVIAPIGVGAMGEAYNINADTAASEIAVALKAEKLIFLTDIDGVRADCDDAATLIPSLSLAEARGMISSGAIDGGMIPKVESCAAAVENGVKRVHIVSGMVPHAIILEMLTDRGVGTMFFAA
ncbi:MAG: acetylglutamate kinase [Clostridia bacterium]|nr:acetylglutamate kinase [Clostridia bacterium]